MTSAIPTSSPPLQITLDLSPFPQVKEPWVHQFLIIGHAQSLTTSAATLKDKVSSSPFLKDFASFFESGSGGLNFSQVVDSVGEGDIHTIFLPSEGSPSKISKLSIGIIPTTSSRYNCALRPDVISRLVKSWYTNKNNVAVLVVIPEPKYATTAVGAVARTIPLYSARSKSSGLSQKVFLDLLTLSGELPSQQFLHNICTSVQLCARLVDAPPAELNTTEFIQEAKNVAQTVGASIEVISGESLQEKGLGGIWAVGKAARSPPALVILSHKPSTSTRNVVWVGKGIVFDTGGLSLKSRDGMCGMKRDMGGAAGILGAFKAAVQNGFADNLFALLCIAENAIGPDAVRPDDIIYMYSGKTVEVNNPDAEGRVVLGDGVAYAVKNLAPDVIVDMATLTGAQGMATGKKHASIVSTDQNLEEAAVKAGLVSGEMVHPLPYCPEFYASEFSSAIADMKNSARDRSNNGVGCAAQFVANHLGSYDKPWLHIDMSYPAYEGERSTGWGVLFLNQLFPIVKN